MPRSKAPQAGGPGWPLTPEALHSLPARVLITEADERLLDGGLQAKRRGCGSGACGTQGAGPLAHLPLLPPYLGVLHQDGHGLLSISTCLDQPEGQRDHSPACSALPPLPRLWPGGPEQGPLHRS